MAANSAAMRPQTFLTTSIKFCTRQTTINKYVICFIEKHAFLGFKLFLGLMLVFQYPWRFAQKVQAN